MNEGQRNGTDALIWGK